MCLQQQQKVFGWSETADPAAMNRNKETLGETDTMSFCCLPMYVAVREVRWFWGKIIAKQEIVLCMYMAGSGSGAFRSISQHDISPSILGSETDSVTI
jgi:hypothetical protein